MRENNIQEAFSYNQKALNIINYQSGIQIDNIQDPDDLVNLLLRKGRILEKLYLDKNNSRYLELANETFQEVCDIIYLSRQRNRKENSQLRFEEEDYIAYEKLISSQLLLDKIS